MIIGFSMTACVDDLKCEVCGKEPCECVEDTICDVCGKEPCECLEDTICEECGQEPCECVEDTICEVCGQEPCECAEDTTCEVCNKEPCECNNDSTCEVCGKEPCECVEDTTCEVCKQEPCVCNDIDTGTNFTVTSTAEWNSALESIRNSDDGTTDAPELYTITVNGNISVPGFAQANHTFGTAQYIEVTLIGNGKLTLNSAGSIINLKDNQTFVINSGDLTLEGITPNTAPVILVTGAALELKAGTITNNDSSGISPGGIGVYQNGVFTLSGGTISNNKGFFGGGVDATGGTISMSGGTISGNEAVNGNGGGVYVGRGGVFNMSGGTIRGNKTNRIGGGIAVGFIERGYFNKTGGTIYGNNEGINSNSAVLGQAVSFSPYECDTTLNTTDNIDTTVLPDISNIVYPDSPVTITNYGWTINRWRISVVPPTNAILENFSVNNETGVVTTTIGGEAGGSAWRIRPEYIFYAEIGKRYEYTFEAWTETGTRDLYFMYYEDNGSNTYLGGWAEELTTTPQTYKIIGDVILPAGDEFLRFFCGDQLGTFYLKMISITEYTEEDE
ncbi:MAG: hypothetical protein FWD13_10720 [Treponema sp.]|nr:hypothetical protein [Treponema sp.]